MIVTCDKGMRSRLGGLVNGLKWGVGLLGEALAVIVFRGGGDEATGVPFAFDVDGAVGGFDLPDGAGRFVAAEVLDTQAEGRRLAK